MSAFGLWLRPLDVLFFRDGRRFAAAARVQSGLPTPQVLAGAVRTALLEQFDCNFEQLKARSKTAPTFADALDSRLRWVAGIAFRGPWLCALPTENTKGDVFVPAPANLHTGKKGAGGTYVLKPRKAGAFPGWPDGAPRPLWYDDPIPDAKTEPASGFLTSAGLRAYLSEGTVTDEQLRKADTLYGFDHRTGIAVNWDRFVAGDGDIYGISLLAPKAGVGFYAEVLLPDGAPNDALDSLRALAFGGEGKRVAVSVSEPFAFLEPDKLPVPDATKKQKQLVLLTTPGIPNERAETHYRGAKLAAVAANSPIAISGWDLARGGPKPTRFAVPAGTVYFLDSADSLPDAPDELGYGCHLQGVWTDG